jgi:hypothetical protein
MLGPLGSGVLDLHLWETLSLPSWLFSWVPCTGEMQAQEKGNSSLSQGVPGVGAADTQKATIPGISDLVLLRGQGYKASCSCSICAAGRLDTWPVLMSQPQS